MQGRPYATPEERVPVLSRADASGLLRLEDPLRVLLTALEVAANAIVITDQDGCIVYANRAFTDLTGYPSSEALGRNARILKSGEQSPDVYQQLRNIILAGPAWHGELVNGRKDGSFYDEEVTIAPVRGASGAIHHFIAIKQDTTERRRHEKALRLTHFTVDHAAHAVFWVDPDGQVFYANAAFCRILGYSRRELLAMKVPILIPMREGFWAAHCQSLRDAGMLEFESQLQPKDGTLVPVLVTALYAIFDGKEYGFAFVRDISASKRTEAAMAEQKHLFEILVEHVPDHIYFKDSEKSAWQSHQLRIQRRCRDYLLDPGALIT